MKNMRWTAISVVMLAATANAGPGPDVALRDNPRLNGDPLAGVEWGVRVTPTNNAQYYNDLNAIISAGNAAKLAYENASQANAIALEELKGSLASSKDPLAIRLINKGITERTDIARTLDSWVSAAKDIEGSHEMLSGDKYGIETASGRRLSPGTIASGNTARAVRNSANVLIQQLENKLAEPDAVTSVAGIDSVTEKLARGQAATGSMLLMPGEKKGEERIAITSGVVDRATAVTGYETRIRGLGSGEAGILEKPTGGEGENASLVMIGDNVHSTIGTGESAILIGDNSKTEGNGIAIGKNATSGNDSIALGNNSVTTGANELSIGNENGLTRKITHMADGTNDSDGATIHNLKSEISRLDTIALDYADTKKEQAITVANQYTDAAKTAAIDVANQYTDNKITTLDTQAQGYATAAKSEAVKDANQYSDDTAQKTLKSANDYTERRAVVAENNAVTRSNAYTDESSSRTLESANTYTNHRSVQAENNAVARSNAYTDNRFGELKHQVDRNEKRANGGIAGAMAMSGIVPVPGNDFSFGIATSGYRDQGAIATGVQARISPNANINMKAAWDSGNGVGVVAGLNIGW